MKRLVLFTLASAIFFAANCQNIWKFNEMRSNGKLNLVDTVPYPGIDISSIVLIDFDLNSIRQKLAGNNSALDTIIKNLQLLQELSTVGLQNLPQISNKMQFLDTCRTVQGRQKVYKDAWSAEANIMNKIATIALNDNDLKPLIENAILNNVDWLVQHASIFNIVQEYANTKLKNVDELLTNDGVYIQMAATLYGINGNKVAIHFEGFDDIKPPEYYDPYELKLALSEQQKKDFVKIAAVSDSINKNKLPQLFSAFKTKLKDKIVDPLSKDLNNWLQETEKEAIHAIETDFATKELQTQIELLRTSIEGTRLIINNLKDKYSNPSGGTEIEIFTGIFNDLNGLKNNIRGIVEQIKVINSIITKATENLNTTIKKEIILIRDSFQTLITEKIEQIQKALDALSIEITGYRTIYGINKLSAEFSDQVKKLNLSDLPQSTEMDIRNNAGYREEGDNIVLEMRGGRPDENPITLGKQYFTLMKTQPYLTTNVGLMFVTPTHNSNGDFTACPSTSILFKFGTKSQFYRKFLDFGVGLNITALDFDSEKDLEIGSGIVGTAFRDYFQVGMGYNLTAGGWYYMIGFRVPFLNKDFDF